MFILRLVTYLKLHLILYSIADAAKFTTSYMFQFIDKTDYLSIKTVDMP